MLTRNAAPLGKIAGVASGVGLHGSFEPSGAEIELIHLQMRLSARRRRLLLLWCRREPLCCSFYSLLCGYFRIALLELCRSQERPPQVANRFGG
jgi:hypothetical protein